jgi:hypothetical protein
MGSRHLKIGRCQIQIRPLGVKTGQYPIFLRRPYFGGCSSLFTQPVAVSDLSGSGPSHSKHWNVRGRREAALGSRRPRSRGGARAYDPRALMPGRWSRRALCQHPKTDRGFAYASAPFPAIGFRFSGMSIPGPPRFGMTSDRSRLQSAGATSSRDGTGAMLSKTPSRRTSAWKSAAAR